MSGGGGAKASLVDVIRGRALEAPGEPAFTYLRGEGVARTVSRGELDERARELAGRVQGAGAGGENVLLLCPPGLEYVVAFLGCLYAGARPVPAYPPRRNRSWERLADIVADAGARYAIGVEAALSAVGGVGGLRAAIPGLGWIAADAVGAEGEGEWRPQPAGGGDVAFLQYTSGSTAAPRGVVLSHANLLANLSHVEAVCGLDQSSRAVSWLPPYHDMGLIGGVLQPLYTGFPAVLMSPVAFLQSPIRWLRAISEHGATISGGPNFAYDWCVDRIGPGPRASLDLSSWRVAFNGAEPLRRGTMERFAEAFAASGFDRGAIFPCYGLAEATLLVAGGRAPGGLDSLELSRAALERSEIVESAAGEARQVTVVGCGPVLPANRVRIVGP
ncbi:MAG TPA: AMP-binding protein, partial [Candidatus Eisenbacteria bacterium]|nr:AMP-binding protein [Candidatus Eisenbacteria bacterium]